MLWVGDLPEQGTVAEFEHRNLRLHRLELPASQQLLAESRGVVYRFGRTTLTSSREAFTATADQVVDHGLAVHLLADDDVSQGHIGRIMPQLTQQFRSRTAPVPPYEIAEFMARHDPGRGYDDRVEISQDREVPLTPTELILLKRAFSDCTAVVMRKLDGGLSAKVFVAHATYRDSKVGPRPLAMFVKIDEVEKIKLEKTNYDNFAKHFIPFHLRPNLDMSRCIEGATLGILAGDFVEHSESLWDVAQRGHARPALYSLFEDALRGWRQQAFAPGATVIERPVADRLGPTAFNYARTQESHLKVSSERWSVSITPIELWERLVSLQNQRFREAPMHGDLHGHNVRVRNGDAILIDLAATTRGPLVADPAALDVWLACEATAASVDTGDDGWRVMMDELYAPDAFRTNMLPSTDLSPFPWLRDCVRQIRSLVMPIQLCEGEYQAAAAVYLLRRTMWPGKNAQDALRRTYAYVLASRLIQDLFDRDRTACAQSTLS